LGLGNISAFAIQDGLAGQAVRENRPIVVPDIQVHPDIAPFYKDQVAIAGVHSLVNIPICGHQEVLGVLSVTSLQRIQSGTQHMGQLIDDLLAFSRLSRQPLDTRVVSPMPLVQYALEMLQHERDGRQVDIHIAPLPMCHADAELLQQVFVNLLANALKFTRRRPVACLEIGCQERSGERVYFVRDNGTGFDMRYGHKLFGVFQRFHRAEDYEGTGVGLAIVQRIVHRHGGRVWVQAEVERGATFFFTLGEGAAHG
jgi:light-regulated signal transduction histidine kinase (bacteriophytochrome)